MKTVSQLKTEIRNQVWPSGPPENLTSAHDLLFQEAFAEIAKWVECEQVGNVDVTDFCKTFFKCGVTVLPCPKGIIRRLYVIANDDFCDPVFYEEVTYEKLVAWSNFLAYIIKQANVPLTGGPLPLGFRAADASTDSLCGRARQGYWAKYRGNIYIAPWIQSMESVVVEWDGIKTVWGDSDVVTDTQDYKKAIKLYFQYGHERDYGDQSMAAALKVGNPPGTGGFDQALADLGWQCRENTRVRESQPQPNKQRFGWITLDLIEKGLPPGPVPPSVIAHLGNFFPSGSASDEVGALVRTMSPAALVACGLVAGASGDSYDDPTGKWFHDFIQPYLGAQGAGSDAGNAFWPAVGPGDWAKDACATFLAWFPIGNRLYYSKCLQNIEFFFLDTNVREPDGNWLNSTQAQWLQVWIAMSTSPWKVVVMADCPYGSVRSNGLLQWPFRSWGIDMVLCSGAVNYERLSVSGMPVINNGLAGGSAIEPVVTPDPNSVFVYSAGGGVGRMTLDANNLLYEFVQLDGSTIDSVKLTK